MKNSKKTLLRSILALLLCCSMLIGTTFAWFTDSVESGINRIVAGNLDVELEYLDANGQWKAVREDTNVFAEDTLWEPGHTEVVYLKLSNLGSLALKYQLGVNIVSEKLSVNVHNDPLKLSNYIQLGVEADRDGKTNPWASRAEAVSAVSGTSKVLNTGYTGTGKLYSKDNCPVDGKTEQYVALVVYMPETVGNEANHKKGVEAPEINLGISLVATQQTAESDSFGSDYDDQSKFPTLKPGSVSGEVQTNNGLTTQAATMQGEGISANVPANVKVNKNLLTLSVSEMQGSNANISLETNELLRSLDVHIEGVAGDNTVPIRIKVERAMMIGLNAGNFTLYHVENSVPVAMTSVASLAELDAHNEFFYDPATGDVVLSMATFSEVALVANTENAWQGNFDYSWYTNAVAPVDGESFTEYTIANADQLAAFGAIVGGMNGQTQDSFAGKTVKLLADINLGDEEEKNNPNLIFYPIGYNCSDGKYEKTGVAVTTGFYNFSGIFDGQGHTISNFYQNTWEMKGDNSYYDAALQYYRDGMGLFGYVYGGTVKNLTVDNFSSDGEYTPTGVIAAYADGDATFENIAITNCKPRVYNTGNGGIIGIAGDTGTADDDHITLKNITVDNSNKISALWGSWDVACGGLVGMYRGNVDGNGNASGDTISFVNCHVSAQIDVYNDVCANYQYYAYRYAGMIIGSVRHNTTNADGKTIPDMTGISASGCTVNYGDWNDYYYCEFEKNTMASYSEDYQFSRVPHSELNFTDSNGNGVVDADERASVTGCKHDHTAEENHQAIYLPFHQLFTGYSWGVSSIGLKEYSGIVTNLDITEGDQQESVVKFQSKFTGDFLYRVGNQNAVSIGTLFAAKEGANISNAGVWVTVEKLDENMNVSGTFTANTSDWTKGTIQFSGTGVVKVTIQDYNFCKPTVLYLEVVDATNLTNATGTTTGGTFVLLKDVNTSTYVNYWNCTLYGNGFTYSLKGAPTAYNSKQGHGILITKNATLDNLKIVGDVYNSYGAYTNQDYYNTAIDVVGDTTIQNCYIANCAAPVKARSNVTIKDTTLYGGAVANLLIMSGTVTLENVTTANYDDGRTLVGMGIVIHSDATESAKLILNGTLTQYNFISESKAPTDSYAESLHTVMFSDSCNQYHFGTSPNRYVNTGIISLTSVFDNDDITDNAKTGYVGQVVSTSGFNGYVYTQSNASGSVNNNCPEYKPTTQGAVPPSYSFDYTNKNYVAKEEGSNDYCYEENGKVNISMDDGDTFNWDTSILTVTKVGKTLDYTVSMNGVDYTGKSIAFNTVGDYTVEYTYTDSYNYSIDENGNITTYSKIYTKTVAISVAVVEAATKHAEFVFGSNNTAATTVTVGNNTYVMPNVSATSSTIGSTTVNGQTIYYPIVEIVMSDGKTSHTSGWYAYFPVFSGAVTITDYKDKGLGDAETFDSSTQSMPSGLSIVGDPAQLFKYQSSSTAGTSPVVKKNILVYSSPSISAKRSEYNTVIQYSYQDNAGTTYYYYIGYHAPAQSYTSCVTADTLVTLADGTQKRIEQITYEDQLLVWDFDKGEYTYANSSIIENHGYDMNDIIQLTFEDGTTIKVVNAHGFFDADLNKWVDINATNATDYIGHAFTQVDGNGYKTVKLASVATSVEYVEAWSVLSAGYYNCVLEGMFSITPPATEQLAFFEIGSDMKYDAEAKQADIEKYGLYTYEEMAHLMTEEQFEAFCFAEIKVAVGKGLITFDELLALLETYA